MDNIRPVKYPTRDRRYTAIIIIVVIIAIVLLIFAGYLLFSRRTTTNGTVGGTPCTSNLQCDTDQSCVGGFCRGIGCTVPDEPIGLLVNQTGNNELTLQWNASTDALSYRIYVGVNLTFTKEQALDIVPVNGLTKILELNNGTTWYFFITAINECGESNPSNKAFEMPEFIWPSTPFAITKAPIPGFSVEGGVGVDQSNIFALNLIMENNCALQFPDDNCLYIYDTNDNKLKQSNSTGTLSGNCLGTFGTTPTEPENTIRNLSCNTISQAQLDKIQWKYNEASKAICLFSNQNICISLESPFSDDIETDNASGDFNQEWVPIPFGGI